MSERTPRTLPQDQRLQDLAVGDCMIWRLGHDDEACQVPAALADASRRAPGREFVMDWVPLAHGRHRVALLITRAT